MTLIFAVPTAFCIGMLAGICGYLWVVGGLDQGVQEHPHD